MIDIDWSTVFVTAAGVFALFVFGVLILIGACLKIAGEISRREDEKAEEAMASMPDHALIDAILQFEGH